MIVALLSIIIITIFLTLASTKPMIVIQEGNTKREPLKMELNEYQDSDCGMVIESLDYASQVVAKDGRTWFFHDHGGFVNWLKDKEIKDEVLIWVMSKDTKRWIDATKAYYSLKDTTPMGYGFGAYEKKEDGFITFDTMQERMLQGRTLNDPYTRKQLLESK